LATAVSRLPAPGSGTAIPPELRRPDTELGEFRRLLILLLLLLLLLLILLLLLLLLYVIATVMHHYQWCDVVILHSTRTSVVVVSPRANSSYEGKRLEVKMEFSGPVDKRSNKLFFEYTGNPNVSSILPRKQLVSLVTLYFLLTA